MNIDWSKWPVDAELWLPNQQGTSECVVRFDENGVVWFAYSKNYGWTRWSGESKASLLARFAYTAKSWTGEGLPPVGATCEYTSNGGLNWRETSVLFIDEQVVLLTGYPLYKLADPDIAFRPIRTPEQVEEDKRNEVTSDMCREIRRAKDAGIGWADYLYAAGYRKQVSE